MSEFWDGEAATFDHEPDHGLADPGIRAAWLGLLTSHLPPAPARVADLGSGTGSLSVLLADAGYAVDGVDVSSAMVSRARAKAKSTSVTFVVADASDPPLQSGAYDAVVCRHVLWALPDPPAALRRWVTLLRPDGKLFLVEGRWHTGAGLTAVQVVAMAQDAGRVPELFPLGSAALWGREIEDERYLVVA